jgi:putative FmdB family regulatory protein
MPIYEYTCASCRTKFDHLARTMHGDAKVKCPKCASTRTSRAMSLFAVGAQGSRSAAPADLPPGMCGRCGGPGPCAGGFDGD